MVVDVLFMFPKLLENITRIIKIAKGIEANGLEKLSGYPSQQSVLSLNMSQGKENKKLGHHNTTQHNANNKQPHAYKPLGLCVGPHWCNIDVKKRCWSSGRLIALMIMGRSYGGLEQLGVFSLCVYLSPSFIEKQNDVWCWGKGSTQSPMWVRDLCRLTPLGANLATMLRVGVVLFSGWFKSEFPRMEVHI